MIHLFYCPLTRDPSPSSSSPHSRTGNPNQTTICASPLDKAPTTRTKMAFLNINPMPLLLPGFSRVLVNGRQKYTIVITGRARPSSKEPCHHHYLQPSQGLHPFAGLRNCILKLLVDDYGLVVKDIQKCPFGRGQAYVCVNRASDRDSLIHHGHHHHQGLNFEFVSHNRGLNARRVLFNRECWLMLIDYPHDGHSVEEIGDCIRSFARLIFW